MGTEREAIQVLSDRLDVLERQNRRLRHGVILALIAPGCVFLMGQAVPPKTAPVKAVKAAEAGKFLLRDGRGRTRAELGLFADRPALVFYDESAKRTMSLGVDSGGEGLTLFDSGSEEAAVFTNTPAGPVLSLSSGGKKRLNLSVTRQGPAVGLLGRSSEAKAALALAADDSPFLHLFGAGEHGGVQLLAAPDRGVLRFFDAADKARAVFGILEPESSPGLVMNDAAGTARAILMLTADGPGFDFFDRNRVRIWTAR
jgi:hypothetical protein